MPKSPCGSLCNFFPNSRDITDSERSRGCTGNPSSMAQNLSKLNSTCSLENMCASWPSKRIADGFWLKKQWICTIILHLRVRRSGRQKQSEQTLRNDPNNASRIQDEGPDIKRNLGNNYKRHSRGHGKMIRANNRANNLGEKSMETYRVTRSGIYTLTASRARSRSNNGLLDSTNEPTKYA